MEIVRRWSAYRRIFGKFFNLPGSDPSELGAPSKAVCDIARRCAGVAAKHEVLRDLKRPVLRPARAAVKKA
jgi:hypothetical protein